MLKLLISLRIILKQHILTKQNTNEIDAIEN